MAHQEGVLNKREKNEKPGTRVVIPRNARKKKPKGMMNVRVESSRKVIQVSISSVNVLNQEE